MKVLFIGTVKFSQSMLRVLIKEKVEIVGSSTGLKCNSVTIDIRKKSKANIICLWILIFLLLPYYVFGLFLDLMLLAYCIQIECLFKSFVNHHSKQT